MNFNDEKVLLVAKVAGGTALAAVVTYVAWRKFRNNTRKEYPRDTVILHQPERGPNIPCLVPFAMKLETYLRMAKIPYQNVFGRQRSKKNKFPWIEYNGETYTDSEFIIEYLNKTLDINFDKSLTAKQRGMARAFQKMFEENTYWGMVLDRWIFDKDTGILKMLNIPSFLGWFLLRKIRTMTYSQGMGRHSKDEVYHIIELDLKALSEFLGNNAFLFGDAPCQEDCAVFGQLSQFYWQSSTRAKAIVKKYKNLCDYCERMKTTFWPDWDAVVHRE